MSLHLVELKKKFDWTLIGVVLISVIFSAIIVFPTSPLPFGEKIKLTLIPMAFLVGLYILGRWSAKIMNKKEESN